MQNEANKIKKEAEELDQLIDRKLKDYEDLREDMKGKELEVKNLLEKGKTEQQVSSVIECRLLCLETTLRKKLPDPEPRALAVVFGHWH